MAARLFASLQSGTLDRSGWATDAPAYVTQGLGACRMRR